ncbi:MAG: phosphoribosylaminoimidazolesuccinocarboxamide synthase [Rickettsiaceae bacterium]
MKEKIYQGSSKALYQIENESSLIMSFNDCFKIKEDKTIEIPGKGVLNNHLSSFLMNKLNSIGIETHFIEKVNMREQIIYFADIVPIKIAIASVACGRYHEECGIENGYVFNKPMIDFIIKNNKKYPVINEEQLITLKWLSREEIEELKEKALRIYDCLTGIFISRNIRLVELMLEFGVMFNGDQFLVILTDEISFDNSRLWDASTNDKLSFEMIEDGNSKQVIKTYQDVLTRLNIE